MANPTRRYTYDEDSASSQNLWIMVLFVAAAVGAFLFGRFVLGEHLKGGAVQVRNASTEPQPPVASAPVVAPVVDPTVTAAAAPVLLTPPSAVTIETAPEEKADPSAVPAAGPLNQAIPSAASAPAQPAVADPAADPEAAARQREADRKKREEAARKRREAAAKQEAAAKLAEAERKRAEERAKGDPAAKQRPTESRPEPARTVVRPKVTPAPKPAASRPEPQPAAAPTTTASAGKLVRLKAGSFDSADAADARKKELAGTVPEAYVRSRTVDGKKVYDVQVGAYEDEANARARAKELRDRGIETSTSTD